MIYRRTENLNSLRIIVYIFTDFACLAELIDNYDFNAIIRLNKRH